MTVEQEEALKSFYNHFDWEFNVLHEYWMSMKRYVILQLKQDQDIMGGKTVSQ